MKESAQNLLLNERKENWLKFDMLANANQKISRILDQVRQRANLHIFHMIVMYIKIFYTSASLRPTDIGRHYTVYRYQFWVVKEKNVPLIENLLTILWSQ
jgi:hypothetical protein